MDNNFQFSSINYDDNVDEKARNDAAAPTIDHSRRNRIIAAATITLSIISVIILVVVMTNKVATDRSNQKKLDAATTEIKKTNKNIDTSIFAMAGDCMAVTAMPSGSKEGYAQPQYYIVCSDNGKQVVKLGPTSSFNTVDMLQHNIPAELQAKLTGQTTDQIKKQQAEYNNGTYLANQTTNGIKGSPNLTGSQGFASAGMDVSQQTLDSAMSQVSQYFANINRGYDGKNFTPVTDPAKQIATVNFSNPAGDYTSPDVTKDIWRADVTTTSGTGVQSKYKITIVATFNDKSTPLLTLDSIDMTDENGNPVSLYNRYNGTSVPIPPTN